jgi:O-antigen ligase
MAGAVLGLAGSRFALVAAAVVVLLALAAPEATVGAKRAVVAGAVCLLGGVVVSAHLLVGGSAPATTGDGDGSVGRLAALGAIVAVAAVLWPVIRRLSLRSGSWNAPVPRGVAAALAICGCVIAIIAGAGAGASLHPLGTASGTGPGGITHGRVSVWKAGIATAQKRPILGSGADTFLVASRDEQTRGIVRYGFNLPIELAVELGVLGLALALALYVTCAAAVWRARRSPALWLLGPGIGIFLLFNLVDWSWHVAAAGALWAIALGAVCAQGSNPAGR